MIRQLTKREYLGEGYYHYFKDAEGNLSVEECTQAEYESLGVKGGAKNNPVREGLTWLHSAGGTIKVDTPNGHLGENEYTIKGDKAIVNVTGKRETYRPTTDIINDTVDESLMDDHITGQVILE